MSAGSGCVRSGCRAGPRAAADRQRRCGGHQPAGVLVPRILQYRLRRTGFHRDTVVHDDHRLGALCRQRQVVGDQQHGRAEVGGEPLQVVEHLALHRDVQRGGRLVGDQQPRPPGQPDGDQRALAHAAGQLVRVAGRLFRRVRHSRRFQQLHRATPGVAVGGVGPQRFPDLEADLPDRVQVGHRVLRDVADLPAAHRSQCAAVGGRDVHTIEHDAPGRDSTAGRQQSQDRGGGAGFPRPGLAHHRDGLAGQYPQIQAAHRGVLAEPDMQALDRQQRGGHARHARDAGSRASRSASPIIMKASTVAASAPAG